MRSDRVESSKYALYNVRRGAIMGAGGSMARVPVVDTVSTSGSIVSADEEVMVCQNS